MFRCIERVLKKRSKADRSPAIFQPNHTLYGALMVAAVVITVIAALIPGDSPLSSIMLGIGSGGIASVVVAWLIDISTCKQNNKKAEDTQRLVFSPIRSSIESAIEFFALQCIHSGNIQDFNCKKTWLDWMREACTAAKKDQEDLRLFCIQCCVLADDIKQKASIINFQTASLFDSYAINEEDQKCISIVMNVCEFFQVEQKKVGITPDLADKYLRNYSFLHTIINNLPILSEFNNTEIGSMLFLKYDKETLSSIFGTKEEEVQCSEDPAKE